MATYNYNGESFHIERICSGSYEMSQNQPSGGQRIVRIARFSKQEGAGFNGWVVHAGWDTHLYSDALETYAYAKEVAANMIQNKKGW